ncbi:MAG TPA: SpoIIE family protein phosphatase [Oscillatoriaceae cyanobacterium]
MARKLKLPLIALIPLAGLLVWLFAFATNLQQLGQPFPGFRLDDCRVIDDLNQPSWPGLKAGLRSGDTIVAVDGKHVESGREVRALIRARGAGATVHYDYTRDGKPGTVAVRLSRYGLWDFAASFLPFFLIGLVMLAIGASAAVLKPDNKAAVSNLWLSTGMGVVFVLWNDYDLTYLFPPIAYYGASFLYSSAALAMVLNFPQAPPWVSRRSWLQLVPYAIGALFTGGLLFLYQTGGGPDWDDLATTLISAWPILVLLIAIGVFSVRLRRMRDARQRVQMKVFLLGIAFAYLPTVFFDKLPLAITGQPTLPLIVDLTYACWVFFPLSVAYAIIKHNLFDITIIIKRTTTYAALTAFLVGGYFSVAAGVRVIATWLLGSGYSSEWENVIATAMIAVAFMPVRTAIATRIDKLFSRTKYDFRQVVARVTTKAQSTLDISAMKTEFMAAIDAALHPRYIYVLSMVPQGDLLMTMGTHATWGEPPVPELKVPADDPLLLRADKGREVEYTPNTGATGQLSPLAALGPHYRLPLKVGEEVVGLVILGPKQSDEDYSGEDKQLLGATRLPLASALKTAAMVQDRLFKDRVEQELKRAREVQEAMLPRGVPQREGFEFAASSKPCLEASGDYYDFLELPDGRVGIAVADVAGKGIAAAMATAMAKSALYNQAQSDPEVLPMMGALNRLLYSVSKHSSAKSFTTCVYALLDPTDHKLTFSTAGHFAPQHYDARHDRLTEFPLGGGFPLGVREKSKYVSYDVTLAPGDVLVFFTDGVTEAQAPENLPPGGPVEPGEMFESERLSEVLLANKHKSADAIHAAILEAVDGFVQGQSHTDDVTVIVLKVAEQASV